MGATILPGLKGPISIPKQTAAATAYWLAEGGDVTDSDSAFGAVALAMKTVAASTPFTRQMLMESNPSIEAMVMADLAQVLAIELDRAAINGSGSSNQPTGLLSMAGVGTVDASGGFSWADAVEFKTDVKAANSRMVKPAYLTNATVEGGLEQIKKDAGSGLFLLEI